MTVYTFETMTQANADAFVAARDSIFFSDAANTALNLTVSNGPASNQVTLTTLAGISRIFDAGLLQDAALAGRISFRDSDTLLVTGTAGNNASTFNAGVSATSGGVFYGFDGNDTITTSSAPGYAYGGNGNDSIAGGAGNDHLYGFGLTGDPSTDGIDNINGGAGNDYIQGNAGNDVLAGGDGSDRIQGGQGQDRINGDDGNDVINGNRGNDTISGGEGNDIARGGQDNDQIGGDAGNDILSGDLGNDTLTGGAGYDVLTGGAGNDLFVFGNGDAFLTVTGPSAFLSDRITDFTIGQDKIDLGFVLGANDSDIRHAPAGSTVTSLSDASQLAQQVIDAAETASAGAGASAVVAIQVGSDTYLFYHGNGSNEVNGMIRLDAVVAADFTGSSIFH